MPFDSRPPREQLVEMMRRIYQFRMTTTSGGNLSIRDDDGTIWITPPRRQGQRARGRHGRRPP